MLLQFILLVAYCALVTTAHHTPIKPLAHYGIFDVRPFSVDLEKDAIRMLRLIRNTRLPDEPEWPALGNSAGIDLDVLKNLRSQWLTDFDWRQEQRYINRSATSAPCQLEICC